MDTNQVEEISVGLTKAKFAEIIKGMQKELDSGSNLVEFTVYGVPNGQNGPEEIKIVFSNDDMESNVNTNIDGTKIYIDYSEF